MLNHAKVLNVGLRPTTHRDGQGAISVNAKPKILRLLDSNRDNYISGNSLAKELSISRSAVWKAVESMRREGYEISAVTNKGYRLVKSSDALTEAGIVAHIKNEGTFHVDVRRSATSTNTLLRELAAKGAPEGYVIAADEQTAGKGRLGRQFYSPAGCGAYFSLLLRPGPKASETALITPAAAVAVAQSIEEVTGMNAGIKWVNDLFMDEKKICGILTEASFDMESGLIDSAVLGIGINVTQPPGGYPEGIGGVAAPIMDGHIGRDGERCRLIAATLDNFWAFYRDLSARSFLDEYRARSILLGQDIFVLSHDGKRPARALEIDDDCRLIVQYENGEIAALSSGEVSTLARQAKSIMG